METAKLMLTYSLPIKCMESVIMAIYLTNQVNRLIRFPISFKSCHNGTFYYHIVLGLIFDGKYGSVGLSRKANLMGYRGLITLLYLVVEPSALWPLELRHLSSLGTYFVCGIWRNFCFISFFQCKLHYHHHHDSQEPHTSVLWALRFKTKSSSLTSCLTWSRNFNCRTRPMIINLSRWKSGAQYLLIHAPKLILNGQKRKSWYVNQLNGQVLSG